MRDAEHKKALAVSGRNFNAAKRARRAAELIHPKDEAAIRLRAFDNVREDLAMLIEGAKERAKARTTSDIGPRTKLLAETELALLKRAMWAVERAEEGR